MRAATHAAQPLLSTYLELKFSPATALGPDSSAHSIMWPGDTNLTIQF